MPQIKVIPTLSSSGWVRAPTEKIDRALSYALTTDALQSTLYRGNLTSIPAIIQANINNRSGLANKAQAALDYYFKRLFDDAAVDVEVHEVPNKPSQLNLIVRIRVTDQGVGYDVAREATMHNGFFMRIKDINNG